MMFDFRQLWKNINEKIEKIEWNRMPSAQLIIYIQC